LHAAPPAPRWVGGSAAAVLRGFTAAGAGDAGSGCACADCLQARESRRAACAKEREAEEARDELGRAQQLAARLAAQEEVVSHIT
jgi:hypothetical protein